MLSSLKRREEKVYANPTTKILKQILLKSDYIVNKIPLKFHDSRICKPLNVFIAHTSSHLVVLRVVNVISNSDINNKIKFLLDICL